MERLGHGPLFRASLAGDIKDDIKFLTTPGGVGAKTTDQTANATSTIGGGPSTTTTTNWTPYLVGALVLAGVWYYTRA